MFDVGFSELVLLFVIGLLILGPERLPRVAAKLGRWVGRARRTATQLRMQFEREMTMQDIMRQQRKPPPANETKEEDPKKEDTKRGDTPESDESATRASTEPPEAGRVAGEQTRGPDTHASRGEDSSTEASVARSDEGR